MIGGVPIPERMRKLPVDRRGYPIPVIVYRDKGGTPHFTINDQLVRHRIVTERRCGICGDKLFRGKWFCGGPMSALLPHGAYIDPPMHYECMAYCLQVCPYLAMMHYAREVGSRTIKPEQRDSSVLFADQTVIEGRPDVFVGMMCTDYTINKGNGYLMPKRPALRCEYWRHGERLDDVEGERLAREFVLHDLKRSR